MIFCKRFCYSALCAHILQHSLIFCNMCSYSAIYAAILQYLLIFCPFDLSHFCHLQYATLGCDRYCHCVHLVTLIVQTVSGETKRSPLDAHHPSRQSWPGWHTRSVIWVYSRVLHWSCRKFISRTQKLLSSHGWFSEHPRFVVSMKKEDNLFLRIILVFEAGDGFSLVSVLMSWWLESLTHHSEWDTDNPGVDDDNDQMVVMVVMILVALMMVFIMVMTTIWWY